ncbi:PepSY-associated TM helix domain-containing protein [Denitratisoma sp. agr-D3]
MSSPAAAIRHQASQHRAAWLKTLHRWHWISAAITLIGLLLFSVTGITLNHAGDIKTKPRVISREVQLPAHLLPLVSPAAPMPLRKNGGSGAALAPLPDAVRVWLGEALSEGISATQGEKAEWAADEIYLPLPRPGGDAWLRILREDGVVEYEATDQGWIAYFNDLHKGRNTGTAWSWFIDLFAVICLLSSLTGLLILQFHAGQRPSTWPLVTLGLVLPLLLTLLFIH